MIMIISKEINTHISSETIGGKAYSLTQLSELKLNIPPFAVIQSSIFIDFLEKGNIKDLIKKSIAEVCLKDTSIDDLKNISKNLIELVQNTQIETSIVNKIKKFLTEQNIDDFAIRSSASQEDGRNNSWAGQFDSILNSNLASLELDIKKCWSSYFSLRSLMYRKNFNIINDELNFSLIVQKMIKSDISGVLFTVNPINKDYNQMVIESTFGLGDLLVSGKILPDIYFVSKVDNKIITKNINNIDETLNAEIIFKLCSEAKKIEEFFKFPCDIEWTIENNILYVLQSRRVTNL